MKRSSESMARCFVLHGPRGYGGWGLIRALLAAVCCYSQLISVVCGQTGSSLAFLNTPLDLDGVSDNISLVIEGSVIQLHCAASGVSAPPSITWTRDGSPIPSNAKTYVKATFLDNTASSVLTIDTFLPPEDAGTYECRATDGTDIETASLQLNGVAVDAEKLLRIVTDLTTADTDGYADGRIRVSIGTNLTETLWCAVERSNRKNTANSSPQVKWMKDGRVIENGIGNDKEIILRGPIDHNSFENNSTLNIYNFKASDAGVYQCVFYDRDSQREVITTQPLRIEIDTGAPISIQALTPSEVIISPTEPLLVEVEALGDYDGIQWTRGNASVSHMVDSLLLQNFGQRLFISDSNANDLGSYNVTLVSGTETSALSFSVSQYGSPITMATIETAVTVMEGMHLRLSCSSIGNPTPSIEWKMSPFDSLGPNGTVDSTTQQSVSDVDITETSVSTNTSSVLETDSASHSLHQGVYSCVGSNSHNGTISSSSALIRVEIYVVPEVSLSPSTTTIRIGPQYNLTIYCNVDRGYPTEYTYYWTLHTQDSQSINLDRVQGSAYSLYGIGESDLGIYSCVVENSAGRSNPGVLQVQEGTIIGPVPSGTTPTPSVSSTTKPVTPATESDASTLAIITAVVGVVCVLLLVLLLVIIFVVVLMKRGRNRSGPIIENVDSSQKFALNENECLYDASLKTPTQRKTSDTLMTNTAYAEVEIRLNELGPDSPMFLTSTEPCSNTFFLAANSAVTESPSPDYAEICDQHHKPRGNSQQQRLGHVQHPYPPHQIQPYMELNIHKGLTISYEGDLDKDTPGVGVGLGPSTTTAVISSMSLPVHSRLSQQGSADSGPGWGERGGIMGGGGGGEGGGIVQPYEQPTRRFSDNTTLASTTSFGGKHAKAQTLSSSQLLPANKDGAREKGSDAESHDYTYVSNADRTKFCRHQSLEGLLDSDRSGSDKRKKKKKTEAAAAAAAQPKPKQPPPRQENDRLADSSVEFEVSPVQYEEINPKPSSSNNHVA